MYRLTHLTSGMIAALRLAEEARKAA